MPSTTLATAIGELRLVVRDEVLEAIDFVDEAASCAAPDARESRASPDIRSGGSRAGSAGSSPATSGDGETLEAVSRQLTEYFEGRRRDFDLPLRLRGTPFQVDVWEQLREIGYGDTVSYGELARRIGRPGAARAVGLANGRNPIPIVVPCHRVIGSDGSLTGYGGGMSRKRALLNLEGATLAPTGQAALF